MTQLLLVRHGDYLEGQADGQGPKIDLGLSDAGREQARRLRDRLAASPGLRPAALLCSTERRALETAALVAPALGLPVTPDRDLEEWRSSDGSLGSEAFMAQWHALADRDRPFHRFVPGCETGIEFMTRVQSALQCIATAHAGGTVVLMTHGGFIQVSFQYFFGFGDAAFRRAHPAAGHASITRWLRDDASGKWALERFNDRSHIEMAL